MNYHKMKTVKVNKENLKVKEGPISQTGFIKLVQKVKKVTFYSVKESMVHFEQWLETRKNK
jgi:hypothetical protein